jgi:hypothetical protein
MLFIDTVEASGKALRLEGFHNAFQLEKMGDHRNTYKMYVRNLADCIAKARKHEDWGQTIVKEVKEALRKLHWLMGALEEHLLRLGPTEVSELPELLAELRTCKAMAEKEARLAARLMGAWLEWRTDPWDKFVKKAKVAKSSLRRLRDVIFRVGKSEDVDKQVARASCMFMEENMKEVDEATVDAAAQSDGGSILHASRVREAYKQLGATVDSIYDLMMLGCNLDIVRNLIAAKRGEPLLSNSSALFVALVFVQVAIWGFLAMCKTLTASKAYQVPSHVRRYCRLSRVCHNGKGVQDGCPRCHRGSSPHATSTRARARTPRTRP